MSTTITMQTPSILHSYHGGTEEVHLDDFVNLIVQDYEVAEGVVGAMIAFDQPYTWNEDQDPEFYAEFSIINRPALLQQYCVVYDQETVDEGVTYPLPVA